MKEYRRTRGDAKKFLRDLVIGKTYYSIEECAQPWGNEPKWRPWVFKNSRVWGPVSGHMTAEAVLSNYGPLYDAQPSGMSGLFERGRQHRPDPQKAADDEYASRPKKPVKSGWW